MAKKRIRGKTSGYQGWANWETWNVALWIGNDEGLYHLAKSVQDDPSPYPEFVMAMREHVPSPIAYETPDGAAWNDSGLDIGALNEMIREL